MKLQFLPLLLAAPGCLFASYTYYYTDTLTTINTANWYQNGSLTATTGGLTAPKATAECGHPVSAFGSDCCSPRCA